MRNLEEIEYHLHEIMDFDILLFFYYENKKIAFINKETGNI